VQQSSGFSAKAVRPIPREPRRWHRRARNRSRRLAILRCAYPSCSRHNRYEEQKRGIRASLTQEPTQLLARAKRRGVVMAERQSRRAQSFFPYPIAGNHACRQRLSIDWCMPSEIEAISPFVDRLIGLIEESQCVPGKEQDIELALREALGNAVVHGNQEDPSKKVHIHCRCRWRGALFISVRDEGNGFDSKEAQGISAGNTYSEHGRGIQLMKGVYGRRVLFAGRIRGADVQARSKCALAPVCARWGFH